MPKDSTDSLVGAVYDRALFVESTKYARSQTAPTADSPLPGDRHLCRPMRFEEGMNLAHRQGNSFLGFFPGEDAHLGLWREHRALHGDGVWVRGNLVRENQDRVLATMDEIACHGEDEVRVGFEHPGHKLVGGLQCDLGPLRNQRRTPALPECARVLGVAHLRTPADGLRQHCCGDASGCALQKTPYKGAANAETHHGELVDPQMIHHAEL